MLLERLCNAFGVSGSEGEIRDIIIPEIKDYCDNISIDSMGNIIALKKGTDSSKKIMLAAHMDEVGFIVSGITEKGYLEFKTVGNIDTRVIISKNVLVGKDKIPGVIGMKAIHLQTKSERDEVPKVRNLFIDIGAKDKEDAEKYVKLGDYVCFNTKFAKMSENIIKAKALDDRVGCYIMTKLIKTPVKYDTYFCFTTQEEVGLRGAKTAAYNINPDFALILETTTCADVKDVAPHLTVTQIGKGVSISFMDRRTITNRRIFEFLKEISKETNTQLKQMASGGNDAGAVHLTREGIKTATFSVPCRYLHSPVSLCSLKDIEAMKELSIKLLERIDEVL